MYNYTVTAAKSLINKILPTTHVLIQVVDITADVLDQQCIVKQGRFICEFCGAHFYHATALVTHCEKEHGKALHTYIHA